MTPRGALRASSGLDWLGTLSGALLNVSTRDEAIRQAMQAVCEAFDATAVCVLDGAALLSTGPGSPLGDTQGQDLANALRHELALASGAARQLPPASGVLAASGMKAGALAALASSSDDRGALVVLDAEQRDFSPADLESLQAAANLLSLALRAAPGTDDPRRELTERIKELSCLYAIGERLSALPAFANDEAWEATLSDVVSIIPSGWQFPERLGVRLTLDGKVYERDFNDGGEALSFPVVVGDAAAGRIEVSYPEAQGTAGAAFLPEEASLLREIAQRIGLAAERRQNGRALQNERLLTLVHTSPVGMFIADREGRILLINQEAERILGRTQNARLDQHGLATEMLYPDGSLMPDEKRPLNRALHGGETVRAAEVLFRHGGQTITTLVNTTPFYGPDGEPAGAIAAIQDVSPLEEMDRLRGEFLGMVSHELRTPLTVIQGTATLGQAMGTGVDSEARHYFEVILAQTGHLKELVDNLLDMTAIEAGRLSVQTRVTDIARLVQSALNTIRQHHPGRRFDLRVDDGLPPVTADESRTLQVLQNLLDNACKFSPEGSPIEVDVSARDEFVHVRVRDHGEGLEPDQTTQVFRKFVRAARGNQGGLGLGLAIARNLVEAQGGRIWAESEGPGKGSVFTFTLPLWREPEEDQRWRTAQNGATVLALDDDPQMLKYLQRTLGSAGFRVRVSLNAADAERLVREGAADVLLLDLRMPGDSGFDVLKSVRRYSAVPVIILTGSKDDDEAVLALSLGADDFVRKPFSSAELEARIRAVLRRKASPASTPAVIDVRDLHIDLENHVVTRAGRRLDLSATEYRLLVELAMNAGRVLTHRQILERVWGPEYGSEVSLIRPYVKSLRKKLGDDARSPSFLFTERQVGYRLSR